MRNICDRQSRNAGAIVFVVASLLGVSALAEEPATSLTLDDCKLVPDDAARLACYDRVIKAGRADIRAPEEAAAPAGGGGPGMAGGGGSAPRTEAERRAQQEREFGLPEHETEEAKTEIEEITVEIASTGVASGGKLRFVTSEGAVWEQTEGTPVRPPAPGTKVTIRRNFMGGNVCKIGEWTNMRCRRLR